MLLLHLAMVAGGIALLVGGGELLVRGSVATATRLKVAPFVIGASVVAFGTSFPELVVAVRAALGDHAGLVLGNVAGSNIANVLLAVGVAAACMPLSFSATSALRLDAGAMLLATLTFIGLTLWATILPRWGGALLVLALAVLMIHSVRRGDSEAVQAAGKAAGKSLGLSAVLMVVSLAMIAGGAEALVNGATGLARTFGVTEAVIGLSVVAIGTSLPEVTVTALAAVRGHGGLAIGGILGSNLFNLLGVTGAAALTQPLAMQGVLSSLDLILLLATTVFLGAFLMYGRTLGRAVGIALLLAQSAYLAAMYAASG